MLLIFLNAFFAASEIAVISLNESKLKKMSEEGNKKAELLYKFLKDPSNFLATIQIGITLAGFLASASASESFADNLVELFKKLHIPETITKPLSVALITIILSYFTLVLGELVPKRIAMQKCEAISMFAVRPLNVLSKIAAPFVKLLTVSTNFFIKLFGGDPNQAETKITEDEIRMMVDAGQEEGTIQNIEGEMIDNIFEFDDTLVSEIMTHRTDIVALPVEATLDEVFEVMNREKYTRVPVYEETIDNIIGILHVKDLLQFKDNKDEDQFNIRDLIRKPYFIPETKKTDELFKELQKNKMHMAVVIDEYGGTAGIVTIEDLLEEIVGNIFDEYDEEEKFIEKIDENTYMFDGSINLELVGETMQAELPTGEYETLNGFILDQLGRIPDESEKPVIEFNNIIFKVEEIEEKRINKVKACKA